MHRTFFLKATAVATLSIAAVTVASSTADAQRLNFGGSANVSNQPGNPDNLLIDFLFGTPEPITPGTPTGTVFAVPTIQAPFSGSIVPGTSGTIQDLVASSSNFVGLPIANFLTIGGYTFSLASAPAGNTFGPISLFDNGTGTTATFGVRGTVTGSGFATAQNYNGVFTAQFAGLNPGQVFNAINTGGTLPVAFSAEFNVVASSVVPEPSTYALLATGIGALGAVARRRRQQA
jgi:hypothetical protein